jgi:alpha,alpha-trehalase
MTVPLPGFESTRAFVSDPLLNVAQTVHGFWTQLVRGTNASTLCNVKCESSSIPFNYTFVVPGASLFRVRTRACL